MERGKKSSVAQHVLDHNNTYFDAYENLEIGKCNNLMNSDIGTIPFTLLYNL